MRQARLKLLNRLNLVDIWLDNVLLPLVAGVALFVYLWSVFK